MQIFVKTLTKNIFIIFKFIWYHSLIKIMKPNKRKITENESDSEGNGFKADNKKGKTYVELVKNYNTKVFTEKEDKEVKPFSYTISLNNEADKKKVNPNDKIQKYEKTIAEKDKTIKDLNNKINELYRNIENMKNEFNEKIKLKIAINEQIITENEELQTKINNLEMKILELTKQNNELTKQNNNNNNKIINNNSNINLLYNNQYIPNNSNVNYNVNPNMPNYNDIQINYIPQKEKKEKYIEPNSNIKNENVLSGYKEPPSIGLQNIGATCYMNAVLQCLSQTTKLIH